MNLNGQSALRSAFEGASLDALLRALYGECTEDERTRFEKTLTQEQMLEYRALQRLTDHLHSVFSDEEQTSNELPRANGTVSDNYHNYSQFFESQWRTLMHQTNTIRQPLAEQTLAEQSAPPFVLYKNRAHQYGAREIIRYIPKATIRGFTATFSLMIALLLGYMGIMGYSSTRLKKGPLVNKMKLTNLPPPPAQAETAPPPPPTTAPGPAARAGTPVPVPDALIAPDVKDFANVDEISRASVTGGDGNDTGFLGLASSVDTEVREEEADPYAFVSVEKEPYVDIKEVQKKIIYPEIARRAGIEGKVSVRVLVGKNGLPKKLIIEATDSDMLNEAAAKAVMSSVFTPAIQNNQPIDCWVSIPIIFRLR